MIKNLQFLLREREAEIERLKTFLTAKEWNQLMEIDLNNLRSIAAEQYQDIQRLKALLLRAADALGYQLKFINEHCCDGYPGCRELIDELRKAGK